MSFTFWVQISWTPFPSSLTLGAEGLPTTKVILELAIGNERSLKKQRPTESDFVNFVKWLRGYGMSVCSTSIIPYEFDYFRFFYLTENTTVIIFCTNMTNCAASYFPFHCDGLLMGWTNVHLLWNRKKKFCLTPRNCLSQSIHVWSFHLLRKCYPRSGCDTRESFHSQSDAKSEEIKNIVFSETWDPPYVNIVIIIALVISCH